MAERCERCERCDKQSALRDRFNFCFLVKIFVNKMYSDFDFLFCVYCLCGVKSSGKSSGYFLKSSGKVAATLCKKVAEM